MELDTEDMVRESWDVADVACILDEAGHEPETYQEVVEGRDDDARAYLVEQAKQDQRVADVVRTSFQTEPPPWD